MSVIMTSEEKKYLLGKSVPAPADPEKDASTILTVRTPLWLSGSILLTLPGTSLEQAQLIQPKPKYWMLCRMALSRRPIYIVFSIMIPLPGRYGARWLISSTRDWLSTQK